MSLLNPPSLLQFKLSLIKFIEIYFYEQQYDERRTTKRGQRKQNNQVLSKDGLMDLSNYTDLYVNKPKIFLNLDKIKLVLCQSLFHGH